MGMFLPTPIACEDAEAIVETKLRWILSGCTPQEVWLFGSVATGEMTEASDVDLALLFADTDDIREAQRALSRIPRLDDWPQDLVWFQSEDFYERANIGGLPMIVVEDGRRIFP